MGFLENVVSLAEIVHPIYKPRALLSLIASAYNKRSMSLTQETEIKKAWQEIQQTAHYPLYGIIMATISDSEVVSFVQNHIDELDAISGNECCFLFFHDLRRAKSLALFHYVEHAEHIHDLARLVGIDFSMFPCVFFFEEILSGQYVCVSLANCSQQEITLLMRELFDFLRHHNRKASSLKKLKSFKHSQSLEVTSSNLRKNILEIGKNVVEEFLKHLIIPH